MIFRGIHDFSKFFLLKRFQSILPSKKCWANCHGRGLIKKTSSPEPYLERVSLKIRDRALQKAFFIALSQQWPRCHRFQKNGVFYCEGKISIQKINSNFVIRVLFILKLTCKKNEYKQIILIGPRRARTLIIIATLNIAPSVNKKNLKFFQCLKLATDKMFLFSAIFFL